MQDPSKFEIVEAEVVSGPETRVGAFGPPAALEVRLGFFPLGWLFLFCKPVVVINGQKHRLGWGRYQFNLPSGRYDVRAYVPYLAWPECGANAVTFDLPPGTLRTVRFYMWPWVYAPGSISVT